MLYDINRTKNRHHKRRDIPLPTSAQCLNVMGDRLCIGFPSSFFIYSLWEDTPPFCKFELSCPIFCSYTIFEWKRNN